MLWCRSSYKYYKNQFTAGKIYFPCNLSKHFYFFSGNGTKFERLYLTCWPIFLIFHFRYLSQEVYTFKTRNILDKSDSRGDSFTPFLPSITSFFRLFSHLNPTFSSYSSSISSYTEYEKSSNICWHQHSSKNNILFSLNSSLLPFYSTKYPEAQNSTSIFICLLFTISYHDFFFFFFTFHYRFWRWNLS